MTDQTFDQLFQTADNFRNNGRVNDALQAYAQIVEKAQTENAVAEAARAMQMSAASLNSAISPTTPTNYRDSLAYLQNAISLYQSLGDSIHVGGCYRDMGIAASKMNDPKTEEYFTQAITTLEQTDGYGELAITHDKLGLFLGRSGKFSEAISHMDTALSLYNKARFADFYRATTLYDKARVLAMQQQYPEAIDLAEEALSWFEADHGEAQYQERICEVSGLIGLCYNAQNQTDQAKRYLTKYQAELSKLDPAVARVIETELEKLFS